MMGAAAVVTTLLLLALVAGLVAPLVASVERRLVALTRQPGGAGRAGLLRLRPESPVRALPAMLRALVEPATSASALRAPLRGLAAVAVALSAWAIIPFGGRYTIDGREWSLVVADLDSGLLWVLALGAIACCASLLGAWRADGEPDPEALRVSARELSYRVALGVAVLGVLVAFGTLRLTGIGLAQQETFRALGFLEHLGWVAPGAAWLESVRLPAWGVFVQPAAFGLLLIALPSSSRRSLPGADAGGDPLVHWLEAGAMAGLMTSMFLGGWSLPWLPDGELALAVAGLTGPRWAGLVAMPVHVLSFLLKLAAVVVLQAVVRSRLEGPGYARRMRLAWAVLLPLALLNVLLSSAGVVALREVG